MGGPNKGSAVADLITAATSLPLIGAAIGTVLSSAVDGIGQLIGLAAGQPLPQQSLDGLASLTTSGSAAFTQKFPMGVPTSSCGEGAYSTNGIQFYSWRGANTNTNVFDPLNAGIVGMGLAFGLTASDGLVSTCSNHLGKVIRDDYFQDHMDEVNQTMGTVGLFTDPLSLYRIHANRLKNAGL